MGQAQLLQNIIILRYLTPSNDSFKSDNNFTLDDSIVFKDFSDNILVLDKTPTLVITGDDKGTPHP